MSVVRLLVAALIAATLVACSSESENFSAELVELNNRGVAQMGQFRYDEAVATFEQALRRFPDNADVRVNLAIAVLNRQETGDDDRALALLNDVVEQDENHLRALYVLGILYFNAGDVARAQPFFERVVDRDSEDAYAYYFLGQSHLQQDDPDAAFRAYEKAAELNPNLRSAVYGAFMAARRTGTRGRAGRYLARYRRLADDPQSRLAEIKYTRMGPKAMALTLGRSARRDPAEPEIPEGDPFGAPVAVSGQPAEQAWAAWLGDGQYGVIAQTSGRTRWFSGPPDALEERTDHPLSGILQVRAVAFGDLDSDGLVDVYLARTGANRYWRQTAPGEWREMAEDAGIAGANLDSIDVRLFDADHDGDLDIYVLNTGGPNELYNNDRDGTFTPLAEQQSLTGLVPSSRSLVIEDVDGDRDVDVVVLNARTPNEVFINDRSFEYHEGGPPWTEFVNTRLRGAIAADAAAHGRIRFVTLDANGELHRWFITRRRMTPQRVGKPLGGKAERLLWQDINGDGRGEFTVVADDEWVVTTVSNLKNLMKPRKERFLTYLDPGDGTGPGALVSGPEGIQYLPPGPARLPFVSLMFAGRSDDGVGMRSNASGIGTHAVLHVGSTYAALSTLASDSGRGQSWTPMSVGLRNFKQADFVEILWPDGVYQTELDLTAGLHRITETERQLSSCPVVFAWDGESYAFVSDILGVGGLGALVAPGQYVTPRPHESLILPPGLPAKRDDRYFLALAEPMEEVGYFDHVALDVVDLPPGVSFTLDERAATGAPEPTGELRYFRERILPASATANGVDARAAVREADRVAAAIPDPDPRFIGLLSEPSELVLRFDQDLSAVEEPLLVFDGWIEYGYAQTVFAAHQAGLSYDSVTLEARRPGGEWQLVLPSFGYPAGMPRQGSVPMSGLPAGARELRLTTNQQIYWDRIMVVPAVTADAEVRTHTLSVSDARVRRVGFPKRTLGPQRQPQFDWRERRPFWDVRYPAGEYTALGAGLELVAEEDDGLAIIGPGDALEIGFRDSLPPLTSGWTRRFVLRVTGWCKDMDLYTRDGGTVEPLPQHVDSELARSRLHERYNTRFLSGS